MFIFWYECLAWRLSVEVRQWLCRQSRQECGIPAMLVREEVEERLFILISMLLWIRASRNFTVFLWCVLWVMGWYGEWWVDSGVGGGDGVSGWGTVRQKKTRGRCDCRWLKKNSTCKATKNLTEFPWSRVMSRLTRRLTPESQQKTWRGQWRSGKGFDGERFQCLLFYGFEFWVLHSAHKEEIK